MSGGLGPRGLGGKGLQACEAQGSRALPTHLAEAAKAGQRRFAERTVSHCGRQERGGVSLRAGGSPGASSSVQCCVCGWPWWSGHQWPWGALATCSLPCQVCQVSWMTQRSSVVYWENPLLPLFLPSRPPSRPGQPEVSFLASLPLGSQALALLHRGQTGVSANATPGGPHCRLSCCLRAGELNPKAPAPPERLTPGCGPVPDWEPGSTAQVYGLKFSLESNW